MAELDTSTLDSFIDQLDGLGDFNPSIEVRSAARREIGMLIVPWEKPVITRDGPEVVMRGAFDRRRSVARWCSAWSTRTPPAGKGIAYENREDGAWMVFRVSKTPARGRHPHAR